MPEEWEETRESVPSEEPAQWQMWLRDEAVKHPLDAALVALMRAASDVVEADTQLPKFAE